MNAAESLQDALARHQAGDLDTAESLYRSLIQSHPNLPDARHFLGLLLHQRGRDSEAVDSIQRAVALAPDYADAHNNLGNILKLQGRHPEAESAFRRAVDLRPDHVAALNNLGVSLKERGDLEGAIASYQKVLDLRPDLADAHFNLANALVLAQQTDRARQSFRTALDLDPAHAPAWHELGCLLRDSDQLDDALHAFEQASRHDARHADAFYQKGSIHRLQGQVDKAVQALRAAIQLDPDHENAYHYLAAILEVIGQPGEAVAVWRQWLAHDPNHPVPKHMLAAALGGQVPQRAGDDFIRALYNGSAEHFESRLTKLCYRAPELIESMLKRSEVNPLSPLEILDAGCGTGWCGPFLKPRAARLTGVDLAKGMLDRARQRTVYDDLVEAELVAFLNQHPGRFDLVVSADTLIYFGDLNPVFAAVSRALKPGGRLIVTLEAWEAQESPDNIPDSAPEAGGYKLHSRGRFSHRESYVRQCLEGARLVVREFLRETLRTEAGQPVAGYVLLARKS